MNGHEVSAFSIYSATKKPKPINFKKPKSKKKKRSRDNSVGSITNSLLKVSECSAEGNAPEKSTKKFKKKDLIKSIIDKNEDSIFKDCILTTKADNIFFNENDVSDKVDSDENLAAHLNDINKSKRNKKKKIKSSEKQRVEDGEKNKKITDFGKSNDREVDSSPLKNQINTFEKPNKHNKLKTLAENNSEVSKIIYSDSIKLGEEVFSWLLSPLSLKKFFKNCWEQKPLHIKHNNEDYFKCICTLEDFQAALQNHDLYFTKNIDVTSYVNGERVTENPEGKAKLSTVWDLYRNGRSIRLLNPQTFIPNVQLLNSTLQEFFQCFVGANIYLTPAGTQGFAPHYDDIEAFVLQLEGEKHWKLYNPRSAEEVLPRESSKNFKEDEIGEPILEVTLQPGDLLYFPRGIIHQAKCLPHIHSLHITVSCYQRNSWADLLEKVLPVALQSAINEDVEFRKGLPIGYLNSLGLVYSDHESDQRREIKEKFNELFNRILDHCPLDAGVDQLGANYAYDALPPWITEVEKAYGADRDCKADDVMDALMKCKDKNLGVKLIRATSVRLVREEEEMFLYYTTDNSLVYHEHESCSVAISIQWARAVDFLIRSYPKFVNMKEIPITINVDKPGKWKRIVEFVYFLWQKGLLLFNQPLQELCS